MSACVHRIVGRLTDGLHSARAVRDVFLPDDPLACHSWPDTDTPNGLFPQPHNQVPRRHRGLCKFFRLGSRAVELKQTAISAIVTDVIILRPVNDGEGLSSYGLHAASQEYLNSAILEKVKDVYQRRLHGC